MRVKPYERKKTDLLFKQPAEKRNFSMKISPSEMTGNVTYSGRMKSRKGKLGKNSKKPSRRKCLAISQQSVREIRDIKKLVNNFLSHKFSAAGVSYIVRSRSRWRKILWFTAVIMSLSFMGYMTFNVIKEYMNFPKMLIREGNISPKLPFPAVTLCSLNPIINVTSNRSSVYRLMQLKELLRQSKESNSNETLREDCYRHPLCQWSWFNETCFCVTTPCSTEFCLAENSTHCACSTNVCRDFKKLDASCSIDSKADRCICSSAVQYNNSLELLTSYKEQQTEPDWIGIDPSVSEVMSLIRRSKTNDLMDVEEALLPTVNDLLENGIKFDNLVISCSFDGQSCYRENFTVLYHPRYGRCYMFNYLGIKPSSESPVYAYNYGSSSGLRLILHVKKQNAIDLLNAEIGARVVIHNPYHLPFVAEDGINMRPHDMSAIEVKQSIVKRLEPPYGTCANDGRHLKFKQLGENPYSILGCQKACRHHYLMQSCNCTKRIYNTGSVFYTRTTKVTYCRVDDLEEYTCMINTIARIEKGKILCDCRPPCTETIYSTTVSSSEMNENYYKAVKSIRTFYSENGTHKIINGTDQNLMVGVKVYYSTFQVDKDKEQASYSWETLIANIGGNLGFFMGLTLLTFMEVVEFTWDIITAGIRRYMETKAKPDKKLQMFPSDYMFER